jgi:hypothetical protein
MGLTQQASRRASRGDEDAAATPFREHSRFCPNATVMGAFLLSSPSIGASTSLTLEMDTPCDPIIMISREPMMTALDSLREKRAQRHRHQLDRGLDFGFTGALASRTML